GTLVWLLFFVAGWILTYHSTPSNDAAHYIHKTEFDYYQAVITSNTEVKPKTYKVAAEVKLLKINGEWKPTNGKVLLYFPLDIAEKPSYGDVFLVRAMPREVEAPKNPYEFDYKTYLSRKGIYAHHFLRENDFEKIKTVNPSFVYGIANKARMQGNDIFREFLKVPATYSIADAMVLGLRDELDRDLRGAYAAAGAVHILAVSGMHVGIVFLLLQFIFGQRKNSKSKRTKAWFALIVIVCLFSYALLAGLSASVVRATVMFSFIQLAPLFRREQNIFNTLALSAICLLCWNPFWLLDVGFQLSYLAVFGIVLIYPHANRLVSPQNLILRWLWQISAVSFSAQLFTFPLSIYYFHQFPNYFLLTNPLVTLAAIAIMPLGIFLLALHAVPYINNVLALFLESAIFALNKIVFFINDLPNAVSKSISIDKLEVLLLYFVIGCLVVFFIRKNVKPLAVASVLIIFLCGWNIMEDSRQSKHQEMTLHFIPKKSGISLLDGKQAVFISDEKIDDDPRLYDFHLKNYYDSKGVSSFEVFNPDSLAAVINVHFAKFDITWIREEPQKIISNPAPFVLISNNAVRDLETNFRNKRPKQIIIDDSNKKYVVEKLIAQAEKLNIGVISLYERGSFVLDE
ncbi:MAG: ComEC family competence protein, partial [Spirosomaceae bacterium]|nr:ComEC family competence protein [Spirosomataceae bacterium]